MPGGVSSPVRAFRAVGGTPLFIRRAKGAYLYDEDGHAYIDYLNAWGAMLLGHADPSITAAGAEALERSTCYGASTEAEVELSELVSQLVPSIEQLRMVNTGTEATFSAIRLARAYTKRSYFIKFAGGYHGHADIFLVAAGSGVGTFSLPDSPGVLPSATQHTLISTYNDPSSVERHFTEHPDDIAAVIVEPVAGNMGCVPPVDGFLESLRYLCSKHGALLIFDEVMTGFRLALGGAQERFGIQPDLTCLGKVLGGGFPVAAYGGTKDIMQLLSPEGPVYQAGTFSGHPVGMACGLATLRYLDLHREVYVQLENHAKTLCQGLVLQATQAGIPHVLQRVGSMFSLFFTDHRAILHFQDAKQSHTSQYSRFFHVLLQEGIYFPPSQLESTFISAAIDERCIAQTLSASQKAFSTIISDT